MISKEAAKKLSVMLLALVMTLSMTGYTFVEAFAEDGEEPAATEETLVNEATEETGSMENVDSKGQPDSEEVIEVESPVEARKDEAEPADSAVEKAEEPEMIPEEVPEETLQSTAMEAAALEEIKVRASRDETFLSVFWTKAQNAAYYMVYLNEDPTGVRVEEPQNKYIFNLGSTGNAVQAVKVEAYRLKSSAGNTGTPGDSAVTTPEYEKFAEGSALDISAITRGRVSYGNTQATFLGLNLRDMLGEGNNGYAVAQGAATDGTYAYYMMASSSNQMGRIVKVNLDNAADYTCSDVLGIHHANGMTYDRKRHMLVAVGYGQWRDKLYFIDPDTLTLKSEMPVTYNSNMDGYQYTKNGMAAIAYVEEYDVYVTRERGDIVSGGVNDIMVFRPKDSNPDSVRKTIPASINLVGYVRTKVTHDYPETYQSMDADSKYVYFLVSPGGKNSNNVILCLDWNSENLLPVINGDAEYVKNIWYCNNDGSGRVDAVLNIPIVHESEGLFHRVDKTTGRSHFYVSEYYGRWHYKTVTKKVKVKVKWKKVRKWYNKKTHKWTTKKPKKKYRGKSKKVWKYKTKTKKKKVTEKDYWARDDYVYYIGSF